MENRDAFVVGSATAPAEKHLQEDAIKSTVNIDDEKPLNDAVHNDIAYGFYIESLAMDPARRAALAPKVRRKLDMIVLPAVSLPFKSSCLSKDKNTK